MSSTDSVSSDHQIRRLYEQMLIAWNQQDAPAIAACFEEDGNLVGFDGTQADSRADIEDHLRPIFADHPTSAYLAKVRAVVEMIPPGLDEINPTGKSIQTLVAVQNADGWQAALFQSTPAAWHGRPQDSPSLTEELHDVMRRGLTWR